MLSFPSQTRSSFAAAPSARGVPTALAVQVHAPGRLHLGFLDPAASLGRRYGSLGLVIEDFETVVEIEPAAADRFEADCPAALAELPRAQRHLAALRSHSGRPDALCLRLRKVLPPHCGLGSGTQLALAVGRAFSAAFELPWSTAQVAQLLGRGGRSGIGIHGFDGGGFIVDGGPDETHAVAPLLAHLPFPDAWRVVVIRDEQGSGLHGSAEAQALAQLPPLPRAQAADICHHVLMQLLPAVAHAQFEPFARSLCAIQACIGAHFAPAQSGRVYSSVVVERFMLWLQNSALLVGLGQSSWGPTAFAFVPSADAAHRLIDAARAAGAVGQGLALQVVKGRNVGARIHRPESRA